MANGFKTFVDNDAKLIKFVQFINNKERKVRQYPLGGAVQAKAYVLPNGSLDANRITIFRTDQFYPNGNNRLIFRRLRNLFFLNEAGQRLTSLGYSQAQIINYVNNLANKKPNEIDFKLDGSSVGSGTTLDFSSFGGLTVSGGVATVTQAPADNVFTGVVTATSFSGDGSQLTGVANTHNVSTNTLTVSGIVTASSFVGDGSSLTGIGVTHNVSTNTLVVSGVSTVGNVVVQGTSASTTSTDYSEVVLSGLSPSSFNQTYTRQSTGFVLDTGTAQSGNALFHADSNYYYYIASTGSFTDSRALIWSVVDNKWVVIFGMGTDFSEGSVSDNDAIGSVFTDDVTTSSTTADGRSVPTASSSVVYSTTGSPGGPIGVATFTTDGNAVLSGVVTATSFVGDGSQLTNVVAAADTANVSTNTLNVIGIVTAAGGFIGTLPTSSLTGTIDVNTQLSASLISYGGVTLGIGDVDATPAFNLTDATGYKYSNLVDVPARHNTTINEFQWYQQYASPGTGSSVTGPGISTIQPGIGSNPYYYGTQLKPYQEMVWTHNLTDVGAYFIGLWGGTTTFTPDNAGEVTLWEKSLVFRNTVSDGHHIDNGGTQFDSTGFNFGGGVTQYTAINNTTPLRLRYNGDTKKLELYKNTGNPVLIATAAIAEDGNPVTISAALSTNATLPGITTVSYYEPQTNWKWHNLNTRLENNQHDKNYGVVFYKDIVKKGEELVFSVPSGPLHVGIWNGGTGVTGISNVSDKSNWSTKFRFSSDDTRWNNANQTQGQTGIDLATPVETDGGSYSIRFDYDSQKLELWEIDTAYDWKIATANVALGVSETYIYFSTGSGNDQTSPPESLPGTQTLRASDYTRVSNLLDAVGPSIHHGVANNDVWKSNKSLKPGMKLNFTVPEAASNQYWATGYEGTDSQANAYSQGTSTWRLANTERIISYHNTTRNDNYTAAHPVHSNDTYGLGLRNLSWRYNSDNTWDLFDEDTDEVILEGDSALDGNDMYPHLLAVTNGTSQDIVYDFEWDWNSANWFVEYRDYESGSSGTHLVSKIPNAKPLKTATQAIPTQSAGFYYLGNAAYRVTWGEKMRPGQEFSWTQLADNSNGATKNNMIIGVLNSDSDAFTAGIRFWQGGFAKAQVDQDSGFTVSVGGTANTTAGTSMRLQYENGTNKLVCYSLNAGVRTKIAESTSALDGNPVFITMGGESTRIPTTQGVSVYGWEFAHTPTGYYNPWNNWRVGGFPANVVGLTTGNHSTAITIPQDTVLRHKDGLPQGYQMKWTTAISSVGNPNIGQWKTSNATSGITDVDNAIYWDWRFQTGGDEDIDGPDMVGMTINTSNSNYVGGSDLEWRDPAPGSTQIGYRYHSNNTIDLYDFTGSEIIATVNDTQDGNPVYISWGASNDDINTAGQLADDFFSGGDVGIALTTN